LSAALAGAKYAIAYVNRATRLLGDGFALVQDMADVLKKTNTEILAASIKSPSEAIKTLLAGAHHLTLPFDVLQAIAVHEFPSKQLMNLPKTGGELVIRFCNTENFINSGASIIRSLTAYEFGYFVYCW
jgi:transaldolase